MKHLTLITLIALCGHIFAADTATEAKPASLEDLAKKVETLTAKAEEARQQEESAANGDAVAEIIRRHAVRVRIWAKRFEGEWPQVGEYRYDLMNERPSLTGGYLWDEDSVLIEDDVLHPQFIRRIEVEAGGNTVEASVEGYFPRNKAILLKLQKPLPGVEPLSFAEAPERKKLGSLRIGGYSFMREGRWAFGVGGALQGYTRTEDGAAFLWGGNSGLLIRPDGGIVGATFSSRLSLEGDDYPWRGTDLRSEEILTTEKLQAAHAALSQRLKQSAFGIRFEFRSEVEDDQGGMFMRRWNPRNNGDEESEAFATGFLIGPKRILSPVSLPRELVERIESISILVSQPDGGTAIRQGRFAGALRNWEAILIDLEGDALPGALALDKANEFNHGELFIKAKIDYSLRRRKERLAYDRVRGMARAYEGKPGIWTFTNEDNGSVAFTPDGKLLGLSVAQRAKPSGDDNRHNEQQSMFRSARLLHDELLKPDAVDETLQPVGKKDEKRLVSLGIEWQGMDVHLAKRFKATPETRGGEIGLLVVHVYPGTPAAESGLQAEDILLRVKAPDRQEPIDLSPGYQNSNPAMYSRLMDMARTGGFGGRMPAPWPSRRNSLTELLTEIGEGKEVTIDYLRDGEKKNFTFKTAKSAPDFQSAPKYKSERLGLTVKALTHEVKRFFQRDDDAAVVISKVETGGKASVAAVLPYHLITHVNGEAVKGFEHFKKLIEAIEKGPASAEQEPGSVEMTLEYMGKTRLVKMEL